MFFILNLSHIFEVALENQILTHIVELSLMSLSMYKEQILLTYMQISPSNDCVTSSENKTKETNNLISSCVGHSFTKKYNSSSSFDLLCGT